VPNITVGSDHSKTGTSGGSAAFSARHTLLDLLGGEFLHPDWPTLLGATGRKLRPPAANKSKANRDPDMSRSRFLDSGSQHPPLVCNAERAVNGRRPDSPPGPPLLQRSLAPWGSGALAFCTTALESIGIGRDLRDRRCASQSPAGVALLSTRGIERSLTDTAKPLGGLWYTSQPGASRLDQIKL